MNAKFKDTSGTTCSATLLFAALAGIRVLQHLQSNFFMSDTENLRFLLPEGKSCLLYEKFGS